MLATAVNPPRAYFPGGRNSLLNRENLPVSREFRRAPRGLRCYLLHFGNGIERDQWVGPDLFRFHARPRARARGTGGNRRHATRWRGAPCAPCCDSIALAAGMISPKEREMARSSGTHGAGKRPA